MVDEVVECLKSTHGEHERIKNGKYDYCICCCALRKHKKPNLPKIKLALIIED